MSPDTPAPRWFWNDGGPLVVLPRSAATHWEGCDPPSGGRVVEAVFRWLGHDAPATDYDRACDVPESAGMIDLPHSWAVVLGTVAAQSAAWLPTDHADEFYVVGVEAADDVTRSRLLALVARMPAGAWHPLRVDALVPDGGLLLMHAADRPSEVAELGPELTDDTKEEGAVIGTGIRFPAPRGRYSIAVCDLATPEEEYLTFVRFARRGSAA